MKKILMVENSDPFAFGGGSFASMSHIKVFSDVFGGRLDVCIADSCENKTFDFCVNKVFRVPPRPLFFRLLSFITGDLHRYTGYVKKLISNENDYDMCVYDNGRISGTLAKISKMKGKTIVTIHHNYEPDYIWGNTSKFLRMLIINHVKRLEKKAFQLSDVNLFLTQEDLEIFKAKYGTCKGKNFVIGTYEFSRQNCAYEKKIFGKRTIVITGALSDLQTLDGIDWFFKDLYDVIPKDYSIIIAGRNPSPLIKKLCCKYNNVSLIENPQSMDEVIKQADIYVCPTKVGGGIKLRVMDGLKAGMPVIVHEVSARGYRNFFCLPLFRRFKSKDEFKQSFNEIDSLIKNGKINSDEIRASYEKYFSYDAGKNRILTALKSSGII